MIGLSVDPVESHKQWAADIAETQGAAMNYPMIGDPDKKVADLYDMIHPNASDTVTVRTVFIIGPDKKVKLTITYPQSCGRNFDEILRVIDSLQLSAGLQRLDSRQLEGGRGRHHHALGVERRREGQVPQGLEGDQALPAVDASAQQVSLDPRAHRRRELIQVSAWLGSDHRGRDRHDDPIGIDVDRPSAETASDLRAVRL